ncbi:MAG: DUF2490 domain-containing protein [Chitinophagaceae bacterium]|jgi:hypothetical protein
MKGSLKLCILFLLVFGYCISFAQVTKVVNDHIWVSYVGVHPIHKQISLHAEVSWRRNEYFKNPQQLLFRTALSGNIGKGWSAAGGYCFVETYPYGGMPSKSTFPENRIWEQLQMRKQLSSFELVSRLRLEQRFVYQPVSSGSTYKPGPAVYSTRVRLMQRVSLPLNARIIKEKVLYATMQDELFYGFGKQIGSYHFDQNRVYAGLGYVLPSFGRIETGYMHQQIIRAAGTKIENNRTIQINFLPNFSLFNHP